MRRSSARWLWFVLIALVAVCSNVLAAEHNHAGSSEAQCCWLCTASVGHIGTPALVGPSIAIALAVTPLVEINLAGLASVDFYGFLSTRAPPPTLSI